MHVLEQALITFFEQAASRDRPLFRDLEQAGCFALSPDRWCFTLPDLFSFLQQRLDALSGVSYSEFRRAIYAAPINTVTKQLGAEIVIEKNLEQVDRSVYALSWPDRETETLLPPSSAP